MCYSIDRTKFQLCALAIIIFLLSGCQTTGQSPSTSASANNFRVAKDSYTIFYDQKDHLKELIESDNFADASILYEEQRDFFDTKAPTDPELQAALSKVVDKVSKTFESDISATLADIGSAKWPAPPSEWDSIRIKIRTAEGILSIIPKDGVFVNPSYRPDGLSTLQTQTAAWRRKVNSTVEEDFLAYPHFTSEPFFHIHPSSLGAKAFCTQYPSAVSKVLANHSALEIKTFAQSLGEDLVTEDTWRMISEAYMDARLQELPAKGRKLSSVLSALNDAKNAGFKIQTLNSLKIGFVEVTSRTLLKQGQIEFPAEVDVDLPFDITKSELETAFDSETANNADYLIVFDVALAKTRRKIGKMQKQPSQMIVGYRQQQNPEYTQLQNQITTAQMKVQNEAMNVSMAQSQYCYGLGCMGKIISVAAADSRRQEAQDALQGIMAKFNATPMMIDVAIRQPYNYEVADIDASKTMTVHYYVIDKRNKQVFKSTFDVAENKRFGVAYSLAPSDPDAESNAAKYDNEADVAAWEKQASSVKLSQLIDHYLKNESKSVRLTSLSGLRKEMLQDRNTAIANYKANTFEQSTQNDPRFDSVVVIYMPEGGLGSGFFVKPDVVMTNYHVVGEGEFTELKMHDGQETFGKVIARDAVLDLALIKVQARGKPVRFYNKNKIELGSTVEVIGHPRRYEFSITRGVVSAIRKQKSANLGSGTDILQIQVDAAISPGNSGGPVFMDDYVISIADWIRADTGSQNLNFSIHHSEAQRFIRETLGNGS